MNERNCTNCHYFVRAESDTEESPDDGECRFMPPVVVVMDDYTQTMFPQVDSNCHCGQHGAAQ